MVHKAIAGVGALFSGIGLILLIVISVTEDFVVVTLPGSPCNDDKPLGTLGVFTATFDPSCAQGTGIEELSGYETLAKSESPTTEFWPLFPAQQNFGGALGELPPDFTSCEEFYAADSAMDSVALTVAVSTVMSGLNDTMVSTYADTAGLLSLIGVGLHGALQTLAFGSFVAETPGALVELKTSAQGAVGLLSVIYNEFLSVGLCTDGAPTGVLPVFNGCNGNERVATVAGSYNLAALLGLEAGGGDAFAPAFYATVEGALGLGAGTGSATVKALSGLIMLHENAALFTTRAAVGADLLGGIAGVTDPTLPATDFTGVVGALATMGGAAIPNADLAGAYLLLTLCSPNFSVATCTDPTIFLGGTTPPDLDDATPVAFCILANATGAIIVPDGDACDYKDIIEGLAALPIATLQAQLGAVPTFAPFVDQVTAELAAGLALLVGGCSLDSVTFPECVTDTISPTGGSTTITVEEQYWGIPADWTATDLALCNLLALQGLSCGATKNFRGFVGAQIAALSAANDTATAGAFNLVFNALCGGVQNAGLCLFAAATTVPSNMSGTGVSGAPLVNNVYDQLNVPATNAADRIAACEDDNTDKGVFETAQAMIPAAMACAALGAILAAVAAALNKTPVAAVAAVFSLAGGALTVGALMYIRTAPVYKLVGKDPVDFVPLYSASTGQVLGLLGGVLPLLGAVAIAVSAFLNRPGSSSAMTSKVDNTY